MVGRAQAKVQGLEAQVLQLQADLQASELERTRQAAELDVLLAHLPAASLQRSNSTNEHNGHKVGNMSHIPDRTNGCWAGQNPCWWGTYVRKTWSL